MMEIEKATIVFSLFGKETTLEYLNMPAKEIAHALIELAQPQLEIPIPESQIEKFRNEAKRDYMGSTKLFTDFDAYQELYVRLKIGEYVRLEHAKQAYNEAVMAFAPMKKKVFCFDYISTVLPDGKGLMSTHRIEAWDEEHATLLFEKIHPGKSYDKPY